MMTPFAIIVLLAVPAFVVGKFTFLSLSLSLYVCVCVCVFVCVCVCVCFHPSCLLWICSPIERERDTERERERERGGERREVES